MFKAVDNGNSGAITLAELKEGLRKCGLVFKNIEISDIMEAVSSYYVPVRFSYNPYFSACFFYRNSVFLSQRISRNSVSACFFSEANGPYDGALAIILVHMMVLLKT